MQMQLQVIWDYILISFAHLETDLFSHLRNKLALDQLDWLGNARKLLQGDPLSEFFATPNKVLFQVYPKSKTHQTA